MKTIQLTQGFVAFVDDADFERVSAFNWYVKRDRNRNLYAHANLPREKGHIRRTIRMHRFIMAVTNSAVKVDREDHDGLNNQRYNLRSCTHTQNQQNQRKHRGLSKYKGVSWHKRAGKWEAGIGIAGKRKHLGVFASEVDAALAYDRAARECFGEFACTNFVPKIPCFNTSPAPTLTAVESIA
jgi:AP2 domain